MTENNNFLKTVPEHQKAESERKSKGFGEIN